MSTSSIKAGIAPWLSVSHAQEAVDYYRAAFGAVELYRLEGDNGKIAVARLSIGEADFWVQEDPGSCPLQEERVSSRMILTVEDPDSMFEQAVAAGAEQVASVREEHGWRTGRIIDPFGHHWEISRPL